MSGKDISEKMLISCNDVFADIINHYFFNGEEVVKEEELEQASEFSGYKEEGDLHEIRRDELKNWRKQKLRISAFGIENQSKAEREMPIRIMGYDGATYRNQMKDEDPFYPVYSLVLYFGKTHWSGNRKLSDVVEFYEEYRDALTEKFNDYKINVMEVAFLSDEEVKSFKSDFKLVAEYFVNRRKNPQYTPSPDVIKHVDEVLTLLRVMTGDDRYEQMINEEKGVKPKNMCEVLDYRENKGRTEGIFLGEFKEKQKVALQLVKKGFEPELILEILEIDEEELEQLLSGEGINVNV